MIFSLFNVFFISLIVIYDDFIRLIQMDLNIINLDVKPVLFVCHQDALHLNEIYFAIIMIDYSFFYSLFISFYVILVFKVGKIYSSVS